jgi:hypothetical protein
VAVGVLLVTQSSIAASAKGGSFLVLEQFGLMRDATGKRQNLDVLLGHGNLLQQK